MKNIFVFSFCFCFTLISFGQGKILKYECQLVIDNDVFTGDLEQDQYYSSGVYASFRYLKDSTEKAKIIRTYQLNHQMYTPSWIGEKKQESRDRPYAGVAYFSIANEYYFFSGSYLKAEIDLGWLGPKVLMGETQKTWHGWFGMPQPQGWENQIQDTPMINVNLTHVSAYFSSNKFELAGESTLQLGTVYDLARYDLIMRVGKLNPLNKSAYLRSSLGNIENRTPEKIPVEAYFFYSPGIEYVIYNATLQGNLIGKESPYTTDATKIVWQHRAGAMWSWSVFDFGITAYWRRKENLEATNHDYVGFRMNYRF
ncbi:MAG: lipid A 3-O-deacylase [Cyclobacteriaceae bacterium]|jgi:lipid A 3-O-deacylase